MFLSSAIPSSSERHLRGFEGSRWKRRKMNKKNALLSKRLHPGTSFGSDYSMDIVSIGGLG
jgi:hypothetical protein